MRVWNQVEVDTFKLPLPIVNHLEWFNQRLMLKKIFNGCGRQIGREKITNRNLLNLWIFSLWNLKLYGPVMYLRLKSKTWILFFWICGNLKIYGGLVVALKLDIWYERLLQGSFQRFRRCYTTPKQYHSQPKTE